LCDLKPRELDDVRKVATENRKEKLLDKQALTVQLMPELAAALASTSQKEVKYTILSPYCVVVGKGHAATVLQ
jgi:hypothetical protein